MTEAGRKIRLVVLGALICAALALLLSHTSAQNRDLQSKFQKQMQNLQRCNELAATIRTLTLPQSKSPDDSEAYDQLIRSSFPYEIANEYTNSMRVIKYDDTNEQQHQGYKRTTRTITFEDLTLEELVSILLGAESTPGILIGEISPLTPMPQKPWKWKATVKLVAEKKTASEDSEDEK